LQLEKKMLNRDSSAVDTSFCFLDDTPVGKDPDSHSPALRRYHKLLWSRALPDGPVFTLSDQVPGVYLFHQSPAGEFRLSSDSVIATFSRYKRAQNIVSKIPTSDIEHFYRLAYTIGGMLVFPANKIDRKP